MHEWKEGTIDDIAEIITGYAFKGDMYSSTGSLRVVRGENVSIGNLRWDTTKYWTYPVKGLERYLLDEGDFVIGMDGSRVGRNRSSIRKAELPLILAQRVARIRAKKGFSQKYVNYIFLSPGFPEYVEAIHTGTSIPHISQKQIADFGIIYTPLYSEQCAIAEVLSSLDDKIDLLHRNNKTLEETADVLFNKWFKKVEFSADNLSNFGSYFSETIGGEWGKEGFSEVECIKTSCIRGTDIGNLETGIPNPPIRYVSRKKFEKCRISEGDIVIEISGGTEDQSTGRARHFDSNLIKLLGENVVFSNFCRLLRPKQKSDTNFLFLYLRQLYKRGDFFNLENGTSGIKNLDLKALLYSEMYPFPRQNEISKISEQTKPLFDKVTHNLLQVQNLSTLRNTLLPKLMSGSIRVKTFANELSVL